MKSFVYFLRPIGQAGPIKIGHSMVPWERLRSYLNWSPIPLELVAMTPGGDELEHRLHAAFTHLHSHGEWFKAGPELTSVIETVLTGQFDATGLPAARRLHKRSPRSRESIESSQAKRDVGMLRDFGIVIPREVSAASNTYFSDPVERSKRWAIIRSFVAQHADVLPAARKAAYREYRARRAAWDARRAAA